MTIIVNFFSTHIPMIEVITDGTVCIGIMILILIPHLVLPISCWMHTGINHSLRRQLQYTLKMPLPQKKLLLWQFHEYEILLYCSPHSDIIEDVVNEVVGSDDLGTEDYPCEGTMKHWKWWISQNEANIGGQMRSMLHHLMDFDIKFLKSSDSLLKELKGRINPGWLSVVAKFIYNSGGRIEPYPET